MRISENIKKTFVQLLLCVYVFALVKPVVPAITDFIAHHFWESEHISTVHYENGKYHLHIELAQQADENKTEKNTNAPGDEFLALHLKSDAPLFEAYSNPKTIFFLPETQQPAEVVIQAVIPPPEA